MFESSDVVPTHILQDLQVALKDTQPVGSLVACTRTLDQVRQRMAVLHC